MPIPKLLLKCLVRHHCPGIWIQMLSYKEASRVNNWEKVTMFFKGARKKTVNLIKTPTSDLYQESKWRKLNNLNWKCRVAVKIQWDWLPPTWWILKTSHWIKCPWESLTTKIKWLRWSDLLPAESRQSWSNWGTTFTSPHHSCARSNHRQFKWWKQSRTITSEE